MGAQVEELNSEGRANGSVELPEDLFGIAVSEYALYRAVVAHQANQRQGTASTKTRSEIARTSKKHHRQKGTGWARRGSLRSPLVRGGGVAFGPRPRLLLFQAAPSPSSVWHSARHSRSKARRGRSRSLPTSAFLLPAPVPFSRLLKRAVSKTRRSCSSLRKAPQC